MRFAVICGIVFAALTPAYGQQKEPPPPARFGVEADLDKYPQDTPKAAIDSAMKAIDARRYSYLVAHIMTPEFVDARVTDAGSFEAFVKQVATRLVDDPEVVREMRKFAVNDEISQSGDTATITNKAFKGRTLTLKKAGNRWFIENGMKAVKGSQ